MYCSIGWSRKCPLQSIVSIFAKHCRHQKERKEIEPTVYSVNSLESVLECKKVLHIPLTFSQTPTRINLEWQLVLTRHYYP